MKSLREKNLMILYSYIAQAEVIEEKEGVLRIVLTDAPDKPIVISEQEKAQLEQVVESQDLKLDLIVNLDEEQSLIQKMKEIIGKKLVIEE